SWLPRHGVSDRGKMNFMGVAVNAPQALRCIKVPRRIIKRRHTGVACASPSDPESGYAAAMSARPSCSLLLLDHPVGQHLVVGALHYLELPGDAPGQRLLVQRDVAVVLDRDLEGLLDQE